MVCCPHLSPNILTDKMASESVPEFQDEQTALIERDPEQDEQQECGAVAKQSESKLTLYHWTQSFNSQKVRLLGHTWVEEGNKEGYEDLNVLFYAKLVDVKVAVIVRLAIAEKGLRCDMYDVSLPLSEHNEPWFMHLNPTGEVPVLVHDENIICDPIQIMDYLEQHFNDEGTPKLIPEEGSTYYHRVQHYRELLDSLQMDAYTHGCILHPEITVDSHIPAYAATCIRTQIGNTQSELKKLAEQNPELKDAYIAKQRRLKSKLFDHDNMKYLKKLLDELESVMDQVETELQRRVEETPEEGNQSWLCGDFFSMADVSLAVTLHRLKFLGLSRRFWGNGNRVNLETYYERVVERPAFRRVLGHVNNILISAVLPVAFRVARKNAPAILGTTLLIGVLGGATYLAFLYMKKRLTLSI